MELSASFTRALLTGFDRAYADLVRVATRSTGSRDEAGELVHEAWLKLAEHAQASGQAEASGDQPDDTTAYLAVMTQHLALDAHRRRQRHGRYVEGAVLQEQLAPSHAPDVADSVMYRQALAVLETALAGLPERSRAVFVAHRIHGDKQPLIAERLGVSLNTIERDLIQASACVEDALQRWRGNHLGSARRAGRRRSLAALLSFAGVGLGGHLGWQQWQLYRQQHVQWQARWQSPRGQQVRHALPDGSSLLLDALSQAQLQYFAARRSVQLLQGAAFFEVARDENRPFEVQAAGLRITVLGTRFGVEITPMGRGPSRVSVQVESGRVRVEPMAEDGATATARDDGFVQTLEAGQALQWGVGDRSPELSPVESAASWRHGELVFQHATLGQALERLARYAPFAMEATPDAARLPLSGRVRIAQAQAWIQALPRALPVQVQQQSDGSLLLSRRSRS
ncbi:sigma-70 family RNA polymerase sigma factor [Comamonas piscis]|uniref:Sigma-70 family RNA polymerase sigma factor n=1 Tax=Comamonas piscis TaxID=1562974 RepID=A0A7G5EKX9_9BURK|nr:sigma-70 family RNA polymerase sigma factor [Comamonas piscis]QMV74654.1 sigma-70 family RNA polymerase sigma factor [Comamonas piscis]WSO33118.1 sigma-70 family RNA polymerase sigma factor [Comamonas piscis]